MAQQSQGCCVPEPYETTASDPRAGFGVITTRRASGSSSWLLRTAGRPLQGRPAMTLRRRAEGCAQ
jgi:hypothetical protein